MSGFLSLLFLGVGLAVAFPLALHYWPRKGKRKLAIIWTIISTVCGATGLIAGWVYYFYPPPAIIQTIGPPEKPHLYFKEARLEPLTAGKGPVAMLEVQNGPSEITFYVKDTSFVITYLIPEKYLHYKKSSSPHTLKLAPRQAVLSRWEAQDVILSQDQINDLDAVKPLAELYLFARGEYTDENGSHPLNVCWKYDKDFPGHLVFCRDDIKID